MSENHQDTANHNLATSETNLWLPPSYTNGKTPVVPVPPKPKKRGINWGFSDKSFWEWTLLLVSILAAIGAIAIPFVVSVIGLYATQQITFQQAQFTAQFTQEQNKLSIAASERQHKTDLQIASDQQQEAVLQNYLDRMSSLLLNNHLHESQPGDEVRNVARAITLTALQSLNPLRKGIILRFIYESGLVSISDQIIDLNGVDLGGVDLSQFKSSQFKFRNFKDLILIEGGGSDLGNIDLHQAILDNAVLNQANLAYANLDNSNLSGANLIGAILDNATMRQAIMHGVNLTGASLEGANLTNVDLGGADLTNADLTNTILDLTNLKGVKITSQQLKQVKSLHDTTMPDGSFHP